MKRDYSKESVVFSAIADLNDKMFRWGNEQDAIEAMPVGESFGSAHGTITKVAQNLNHSFDFDYNTVHMVFEYGGDYFKFSGWKSSYGTSHWNDWVEQVQRKEETRVFYE